ncbi:alpha/beta-hydrolase [Tilletiopsis washingtonensis]|uniref:Alpha/beta-hydrolase n=1 Tax=Tilletiopsis washingtonensis TaxID=58919 RepID=A0A316ZID9_9BASI|nr:alpha/beta-hydrolase [Tilletiopsis washingtonensis]PWO00086.1 alpha/beta-hydrolase [Tilletiopsis washingtonensis]
MSDGFIDYSARRRERTTPSPPQSQNPFADDGAKQEQSAYRTDASQAYAAEPQQQYEQQPRATSGRGHHFDVEHSGTAQAKREQEDGEPFFDPTFPSYQEEEPLDMVFFDHVVQNYGSIGTIGKLRVQFRQIVSFGLTTATMGLVILVAFANYFNPFHKSPPRAHADREYERRITGERLSGRPQYYSEFWGYRCDEHEIVTEGGWILKAHRISDPRRPGAAGYPVVLQHGILCNSSHFFMCEERSMAFWLVDQGYDVWVTNIRANFDAGHTEYDRWDPRFWAWGIKELAFDLRDTVEFITGATGRPRLAYIGHSQGSGSMYLALSPGICPEIGHKISSFTAIGPSVYAGPVLRKFPFSIMRKFRSRKWWSLVFGIREFIPAISIAHKYLPAYLFGHLAYVIFHFLFAFHDHNWVGRQKPKIFRSLPVGTSSELLYWYMASFSHRGCIFDPRVTEPWFPRSFPRHSVYYGDLDFLVIGKPLAQRLERYERNVDVVHAVELAGYEHLDYIFGIDCWRTVYPGIKDTIESSLTSDEQNPDMAERR